MPKRLQVGQERKISVSVSVDPQKWAELEKRCEEIRQWLRQHGVTEKDASCFSRSALVRSCIEGSAAPWFTEFMKAQIAPLFGVDLDQQELEL